MDLSVRCVFWVVLSATFWFSSLQENRVDGSPPSDEQNTRWKVTETTKREISVYSDDKKWKCPGASPTLCFYTSHDYSCRSHSDCPGYQLCCLFACSYGCVRPEPVPQVVMEEYEYDSWDESYEDIRDNVIDTGDIENNLIDVGPDPPTWIGNSRGVSNNQTDNVLYRGFDGFSYDDKTLVDDISTSFSSQGFFNAESSGVTPPDKMSGLMDPCSSKVDRIETLRSLGIDLLNFLAEFVSTRKIDPELVPYPIEISPLKSESKQKLKQGENRKVLVGVTTKAVSPSTKTLPGITKEYDLGGEPYYRMLHYRISDGNISQNGFERTKYNVDKNTEMQSPGTNLLTFFSQFVSPKKIDPDILAALIAKSGDKTTEASAAEDFTPNGRADKNAHALGIDLLAFLSKFVSSKKIDAEIFSGLIAGSTNDNKKVTIEGCRTTHVEEMRDASTEAASVIPDQEDSKTTGHHDKSTDVEALGIDLFTFLSKFVSTKEIDSILSKSIERLRENSTKTDSELHSELMQGSTVFDCIDGPLVDETLAAVDEGSSSSKEMYNAVANKDTGLEPVGMDLLNFMGQFISSKRIDAETLSSMLKKTSNQVGIKLRLNELTTEQPMNVNDETFLGDKFMGVDFMENFINSEGWEKHYVDIINKEAVGNIRGVIQLKEKVKSLDDSFTTPVRFDDWHLKNFPAAANVVEMYKQDTGDFHGAFQLKSKNESSIGFPSWSSAQNYVLKNGHFEGFVPRVFDADLTAIDNQGKKKRLKNSSTIKSKVKYHTFRYPSVQNFTNHFTGKKNRTLKNNRMRAENRELQVFNKASGYDFNNALSRDTPEQNFSVDYNGIDVSDIRNDEYFIRHKLYQNKFAVPETDLSKEHSMNFTAPLLKADILPNASNENFGVTVKRHKHPFPTKYLKHKKIHHNKKSPKKEGAKKGHKPHKIPASGKKHHGHLHPRKLHKAYKTYQPNDIQNPALFKPTVSYNRISIVPHQVGSIEYKMLPVDFKTSSTSATIAVLEHPSIDEGDFKKVLIKNPNQTYNGAQTTTNNLSAIRMTPRTSLMSTVAISRGRKIKDEEYTSTLTAATIDESLPGSPQKAAMSESSALKTWPIIGKKYGKLGFKSFEGKQDEDVSQHWSPNAFSTPDELRYGATRNWRIVNTYPKTTNALWNKHTKRMKFRTQTESPLKISPNLSNSVKVLNNYQLSKGAFLDKTFPPKIPKIRNHALHQRILKQKDNLNGSRRFEIYPKNLKYIFFKKFNHKMLTVMPLNTENNQGTLEKKHHRKTKYPIHMKRVQIRKNTERPVLFKKKLKKVQIMNNYFTPVFDDYKSRSTTSVSGFMAEKNPDMALQKEAWNSYKTTTEKYLKKSHNITKLYSAPRVLDHVTKANPRTKPVYGAKKNIFFVNNSKQFKVNSNNTSSNKKILPISKELKYYNFIPDSFTALQRHRDGKKKNSARIPSMFTPSAFNASHLKPKGVHASGTIQIKSQKMTASPYQIPSGDFIRPSETSGKGEKSYDIFAGYLKRKNKLGDRDGLHTYSTHKWNSNTYVAPVNNTYESRNGKFELQDSETELPPDHPSQNLRKATDKNVKFDNEVDKTEEDIGKQRVKVEESQSEEGRLHEYLENKKLRKLKKVKSKKVKQTKSPKTVRKQKHTPFSQKTRFQNFDIFSAVLPPRNDSMTLGFHEENNNSHAQQPSSPKEAILKLQTFDTSTRHHEYHKEINDSRHLKKHRNHNKGHNLHAPHLKSDNGKNLRHQNFSVFMKNVPFFKEDNDSKRFRSHHEQKELGAHEFASNFGKWTRTSTEMRFNALLDFLIDKEAKHSNVNGYESVQHENLGNSLNIQTEKFSNDKLKKLLEFEKDYVKIGSFTDKNSNDEENTQSSTSKSRLFHKNETAIKDESDRERKNKELLLKLLNVEKPWASSKPRIEGRRERKQGTEISTENGSERGAMSGILHKLLYEEQNWEKVSKALDNEKDLAVTEGAIKEISESKLVPGVLATNGLLLELLNMENWLKEKKKINGFVTRNFLVSSLPEKNLGKAGNSEETNETSSDHLTHEKFFEFQNNGNKEYRGENLQLGNQIGPPFIFKTATESKYKELTPHTRNDVQRSNGLLLNLLNQEKMYENEYNTI